MPVTNYLAGDRASQFGRLSLCSCVKTVPHSQRQHFAQKYMRLQLHLHLLHETHSERLRAKHGVKQHIKPVMTQQEAGLVYLSADDMLDDCQARGRRGPILKGQGRGPLP